MLDFLNNEIVASVIKSAIVIFVLLSVYVPHFTLAHALAPGDDVDKHAEEGKHQDEDEPPGLGPTADGVVAEDIHDDPDEQDDPQDPQEDPHGCPESAQDGVVVGQLHVTVHCSRSCPCCAPDPRSAGGGSATSSSSRGWHCEFGEYYSLFPNSTGGPAGNLWLTRMNQEEHRQLGWLSGGGN